LLGFGSCRIYFFLQAGRHMMICAGRCLMRSRNLDLRDTTGQITYTVAAIIVIGAASGMGDI
jgi:hypothetical protein